MTDLFKFAALKICLGCLHYSGLRATRLHKNMPTSHCTTKKKLVFKPTGWKRWGKVDKRYEEANLHFFLLKAAILPDTIEITEE